MQGRTFDKQIEVIDNIDQIKYIRVTSIIQTCLQDVHF